MRMRFDIERLSGFVRYPVKTGHWSRHKPNQYFGASKLASSVLASVCLLVVVFEALPSSAVQHRDELGLWASTRGMGVIVAEAAGSAEFQVRGSWH